MRPKRGGPSASPARARPGRSVGRQPDWQDAGSPGPDNKDEQSEPPSVPRQPDPTSTPGRPGPCRPNRIVVLIIFYPIGSIGPVLSCSVLALPHSRWRTVVVRGIPSPPESIPKNAPGAPWCFRSNCWALPKGAASSVPVSMSSSSPSTWRSPRPRRHAPSAAPTPAACAAGTPAGSTTCPVSAGACGCASPSAVSCAQSPTAHDASSPSASRVSRHRGHGPPTGSGRPRRTSARPWAVRPALASPHAWV